MVASIASEGEGGAGGRGVRRGVLEEGGRARDSQLSRSTFSLVVLVSVGLSRGCMFRVLTLLFVALDPLFLPGWTDSLDWAGALMALARSHSVSCVSNSLHEDAR